MDSRLVVEQMAGNWKIKHPSMKPLAIEANRLAPIGTTFTWVPRAENAHADRLANEALDGERDATGPLGGRAASEAGDQSRHRAPRSRPRSAAGGRRQRQADHARPGPPRRHRRDQGQALLRRAGQLQPAAERRGPRAGPGDGGVAGSAVGHLRRAGQLAGASYPRDGGDPRASSSTSRSRRSTASRRWSSAPGTGMSFTEVHEKWPDELRLLARRPRVGPARRRVVPGGGEAGARGPRPAWWRRTPGRRWSWSAT